jgi:hypothetical protein
MGWIDLAQDKDQWGGSCEHGNEPSVSLKYSEVLECCAIGGFSRSAQLRK